MPYRAAHESGVQVPLTANASATFDLDQNGIVTSNELNAKQIFTTAQLNNFIAQNPTILSRYNGTLKREHERFFG